MEVALSVLNYSFNPWSVGVAMEKKAEIIHLTTLLTFLIAQLKIFSQVLIKYSSGALPV